MIIKVLKFKALTVACLVSVAFLGTGAEPNSQPGLGTPKVIQVADNVIAVTGLYHSAGRGFGVNAGIILTSTSVVFIDSGMTIASAEFLWRTAAEQMKGQKNLYLILTHHHSDHTFGMRVFKEKGAKVIAHTGINEFLAKDNGYYKKFIARQSGWDQKKADEILGDVQLSGPDQMIEKDEVLTIDDEDFRILYTPGHIPTELSVYHPKSGTLFAGDAVYEGGHLTTRFGGPAQWKEWIAQLSRLKELEGLRTVVPGHGELCGLAEIDRNIAYLEKKLKE